MYACMHVCVKLCVHTCVYILIFVYITYIHNMYVYDCLRGLITDTINLPVAVLTGAVKLNAVQRKE